MPIIDLLFPSKYVPEQVKKARLEICKKCPRLRPLTKTCAECGCVVKLKAALKTEACDLKKW